MSTTSSPGRRPLGKPAGSQPGFDSVNAPLTKHAAAPRLFWLPFGVTGSAVFSRNISEGTTFFGWFTPCTPVRNAATRSVRGNTVGACTPASLYSSSSSAGSVGLVTYVANCASSFGSLMLNLSLSGSPITTSLTSGAPSRETWTYGAVELEPILFGGRLVVDQMPITGSVAVVMQLIGSSIAIVVTFLSSVALPEPLRGPMTRGTSMLTRSKISPRLTPKPSLRCPTKTRGNVPAGGVQPGMLMPRMCIEA